MLADQLNVFLCSLFVLLILVSSGFTKDFNSVKSTKSFIKSSNLQYDHFTTSVEDVMLNDSADCDCGPNSVDCWRNNTMNGQQCKCKEGYSPLLIGTDETCEKCDCGPNALNCMFYPEGKVCTCQLGNYTASFITKLDKKCRECDCGPNSVSCDFNSEKNRFCKCAEGYSSENESEDSDDEYCKKCDCGEYGECYVKIVENRSRKQCACESGYVVADGKCQKCDCGPNGIDCMVYPKLKRKYCKCQLGNYTEYFITNTTDKKCKECDCGPKSVSCDFNRERKQFCKCIEGYSSERIPNNSGDEYCEQCDCGEHGKCYVTIVENRSTKECICESGYIEVNGKCRKCDCGVNSFNCTFHHNGHQICDCKNGYFTRETYLWKNEFCERCDCGEFGVSCKFVYGQKICTCQEGYIIKDSSGDRDYYCKKDNWLSGWNIALIIVAVAFCLVLITAFILKVFVMRSRRN